MSKPRWEYKVLVLDGDADSSTVRLNTFGAGGWELVSIGGRFEQAQFAYLKRRCDQAPTEEAGGRT